MIVIHSPTSTKEYANVLNMSSKSLFREHFALKNIDGLSKISALSKMELIGFWKISGLKPERILSDRWPCCLYDIYDAMKKDKPFDKWKLF